MAIIPVTFASLITRVTESENLASALEVYRSAGFAVDSWKRGGAYHTLTAAFARGLTRVSDVVRMIALGGYLDHATGQWLTLLARSWFGLTRRPASYTYQTLRLTSSAGAPPYTIVAGQVWVTTSAGRRFNGTTGGVLASAGTLDITIKAESPGSAYNVSTGTVTTLVTPLPGVTCSNISVVTEGLDGELDGELRQRCRLRWATLAAQVPGATYEFWALTEPDGETARAGVTRVYADIDNPGGANTVNVWLAGPTGGVDAGVVTDVDTDLQLRRGVSTILTVASAPEGTVAPTGTVWVSGVLTTAAETQGEAALDALIAATPIGGTDIGGTRAVFRDALEGAIRTATGVVRVSLTSGDHALEPNEVAVGDWTGITWLTA